MERPAVSRRGQQVFHFDGDVWSYGSESHATAFADGLRGFSVRRITRDDKEELIAHKVRAYRNP